PSTPLCLSCGAQLTSTLAWLASLRCHDCRDSRAPINRTLSVELAADRQGDVHLLRRPNDESAAPRQDGREFPRSLDAEHASVAKGGIILCGEPERVRA